MCYKANHKGATALPDGCSSHESMITTWGREDTRCRFFDTTPSMGMPERMRNACPAIITLQQDPHGLQPIVSRIHIRARQFHEATARKQNILTCPATQR